jgi:acyl-CoA synthetase (AMP-forming)/AMP-acid ligase II
MLVFRSPFGAVGYVEEGGFSRIMPDTWVPTGDLAEPTERGTWRLTGRASEVFKRYGEKISLALLLTTVYQSWNGNAGFYREREPAGEEGHVLVLAPAPSEAELRSVLRAFRQNYPRAYWPLRIESVDAMPLLPNGKANVAALPALESKATHWFQRLLDVDDRLVRKARDDK